MSVNFPNNSVTASGNYINVPGHYIQFVDNTTTISTTCDTSAWVNVLTTSITITNATNKVKIEYLMNDRSDQGNGNWSLIYHRILRNGTQIMTSGYNGANANTINYYTRTFFDTPGAGTWTYTASVLSYGGTAWIGSYNSGSSQHYLRLYEIGT